MDVVITINEQDLMKNPGILDMMKGFAESLAEPVVPETKESNPTVMKSEPQKETPVTQTPEEVAEPVAESGAEITVSIEEVRAAVAKVSKKHGAAAAKEIMKKYGADRLSEVDTAFYATVLEEAKAVL